MGKQMDRLSAVITEFNDCSAFLEWLVNERRIVIGQYVDGLLVPLSTHSSELLYEYFGIDPYELERERRELLDTVRQGQQG